MAQQQHSCGAGFVMVFLVPFTITLHALQAERIDASRQEIQKLREQVSELQKLIQPPSLELPKQ